MTISARPLHPLFAAELAGIDLRDEIGETTLGEIIRAMDEFAVCVVDHDTPLTDARQNPKLSQRLRMVRCRRKSP